MILKSFFFLWGKVRGITKPLFLYVLRTVTVNGYRDDKLSTKKAIMP